MRWHGSPGEDRRLLSSGRGHGPQDAPHGRYGIAAAHLCRAAPIHSCRRSDLTAQGSVDSAVQAMTRIGAYDFVEKPVNTTRLRTILQNATRQRGTGSRARSVTRRKLRDTGYLGPMVGRRLQKNAGDLSSHRNGRAQHRLRPHHRRERHRQGVGRAHHSRVAQPAQAVSSRSTAPPFRKH